MDFNSKSPYQITSMYIDIDEGVVETPDGSTMTIIIERPPNKKNIFCNYVAHIYEKPVVNFCHCYT